MPSPLLPTSPAPVSYRITSKVNTLKSESLSGHILTRNVGGQRFEATLVFPPMNRGAFNEIHAFLMERDASSIFYVEIPTYGTTHGVAGEYINYNNHSKMYMVKTGGVDTYPDQLVTGGTVVSNVTYLRCSLRNSVQVIEYGTDGTVRLEIDVVERI
tara:strand:+ start:576 stop:1046 length:471 start_codon:yes stop_codon:yes gene_type:complete